MGILFSKKRRITDIENSLLLDNLVPNEFESDIDYNNDYFDYNITNNSNLNLYLVKMVKTISYLQKKISLLESELNDKISEDKLSYQNNMYTINEQIDLIHKDLKLLVDNDKLLLDKYNNLCENEKKEIINETVSYTTNHHLNISDNQL